MGDGELGEAALPPPGAEDEVFEGEGPPPPFTRWRTLYALVVLNLALLIGGFYLFMRHFQ